MVADVTIGFVKDARYHIDVQGFNVYHKNRLIKVRFSFYFLILPFYVPLMHGITSSLQPFWRVWNAAGSSGRGVLGIQLFLSHFNLLLSTNHLRNTLFFPFALLFQ